MKRALRVVAAVWMAFAVAVADDAKPKKPDTYPFARGIIEKLDLMAKEIRLKSESGPREFGFTPATYVYRGKEKLTPDKLKLGDSIKLNYYTNEFGRALIRRIKVDQTEPAPQ